jgi:hypothetical protein
LEKLAVYDSTGRPNNRDISKQPNFMKYVEMLEKFGITGVWRFDGGDAIKRQLTGDEKWKVLNNILKEDEDFLLNNFQNLENARSVNKVSNNLTYYNKENFF